MAQKCDCVIVGGGPAGLSLACMLGRSGMAVTVVEQADEHTLAAPAPDGRDIALTHLSRDILERLDVWARFPAAEIAPIRRAEVKNGASPYAMTFDHPPEAGDALGFLVANHVIRRALYDAVRELPAVCLLTSVKATALTLGADDARLETTAGNFEAPLAVAADSRFSSVRRSAGIAARMRDFGRVCIVCRMAVERPHDGIATEWFDYDRTLAALPLNDQQLSIVVTIASDAAPGILAATPESFSADVERRFSSRWGAMRLVGERYAYPLVAVYADRFTARRFALVGDAAVGMHPVTAHGYNFGLRGADTLARGVETARNLGLDFGSASVLDRYDRDHRAATWPLYTATNALVSLFTDDQPLARLGRDALLRLGNVLSPVKTLMMGKLTEIAPVRRSA